MNTDDEIEAAVRIAVAAKNARIKELESRIAELEQQTDELRKSYDIVSMYAKRLSWRKVSEELPTEDGEYAVVYKGVVLTSKVSGGPDPDSWMMLDHWLGPLPEIEQKEHSNDR